MMKSNIPEGQIEFEKTDKDLYPSTEYWKSAGCGPMLEDIHRRQIAAKGYCPRTTAKLIRRCEFSIKSSVSMADLFQLGMELEKGFGIHCFQIAIYRDTNLAVMLFTWVDHKEFMPLTLTSTDMKRISVLIFSFLHLPRPKGAELWLRHFLLYQYEKDPGVFQKALEEISHQDIDGRTYDLLHDSLAYCEGVCKGLLK